MLFRSLQPLVGEISWSKNLLIMARCKDDLRKAITRKSCGMEEIAALDAESAEVLSSIREVLG